MKEKTQQEKAKRAVVYLDNSNYHKLRSILILDKKSVSQWIREKIQEFLG